MKVLFITEDYPDKYRSVFVFVKLLVNAIAKSGNECFVIAPHSITRTKRFSCIKEIQSIGNGRVVVYRPNYVSTSNISIGKYKLQSFLHKAAIHRVIRKLDFTPDVLYTHFWTSAYEVIDYAVSRRIPLIVASGESVISEPPSERVRLLLNRHVSGVICVSLKNKNESIDLHLTDAERCVVIPNATDTSVFIKMDKALCRKKLNISPDDFVVIFVGWFNHRKGVLRVSEALRMLHDQNVKSIFIGEGEMEPTSEGIIYKGPVAHDDMPVYLNAADVFVLPTLREGCCNAIVEALSCGLPIISSDRSFNWDILDRTNSILVDPENIGQIAAAIDDLRTDDNLRMRLADGALKKAEDLSINNRAKKIESFITSKIRGNV